ncbi:hypothetical protein RHD99_15955 [Buttiauxella selenatireducens]|uniref:Uncharacterized protein n=1 Tax=Buttiauxella selenatireducens TaxID=3073902 RepID=A0ABY9S636_9ENTR|nr:MULTISPECIES: hypothetical protein [unclassified Buttiauxella]WMY72955.1 hypothetical protein RHD99_15955 [Buttiauxella sp. R73]GDX08046.1 hypothetical protein BSPA111_42730 [Buttiauxella sp. A111]
MKNIMTAMLVSGALFISVGAHAQNMPFDSGGGYWTPWYTVSKMNLYLPSLNICKYERYRYKNGKLSIQRKGGFC